jgi:hypothetical protein
LECHPSIVFFLFLEDQIVNLVSQLTREILEDVVDVVGLGRNLARVSLGMVSSKAMVGSDGRSLTKKLLFWCVWVAVCSRESESERARITVCRCHMRRHGKGRDSIEEGTSHEVAKLTSLCSKRQPSLFTLHMPAKQPASEDYHPRMAGLTNNTLLCRLRTRKDGKHEDRPTITKVLRL